MQGDILRTLNYADIFDYPLTPREVTSFLISDTEVKAEVVKKTLSILADRGLIGADGDFFYLKGRSGIVQLRKERERWSKEKWRIARETAAKLKKLPGVKFIGVTGALAMDNCQKDDDIDLLIVTAGNSLWLVRLAIILLSPILDINRRKPKDKEVKNKICFNLFLEENHLKIGPENLFLAHEVCQMKPIFNKEGTYEKFFGENKWVFKFLPNAGKNLKIKYQKSNIKNNFLISFFNILAFKLQYFYMKSKITNEKISLHQAFFHPGNLQDKILKDYQQKLGS